MRPLICEKSPYELFFSNQQAIKSSGHVPIDTYSATWLALMVHLEGRVGINGSIRATGTKLYLEVWSRAKGSAASFICGMREFRTHLSRVFQDAWMQKRRTHCFDRSNVQQKRKEIFCAQQAHIASKETKSWSLRFRVSCFSDFVSMSSVWLGIHAAATYQIQKKRWLFVQLWRENYLQEKWLWCQWFQHRDVVLRSDKSADVGQNKRGLIN